MNDSNQYMVQVGDYDQNTYIIQDANGVPVQYDGGAIISGDIGEGNNMLGEPRWIQQNSARGGKIMSNQAFVNGDLVSVNGTGLNLSTRFTPSSIVLNSTSGAQFDQDSLRIATAVTGTGGRGRPRGRKPSRGNFPVVPIDMVRQLGIEQQVILQPTVPVSTKNKGIQTSTIQLSKRIQCVDLGVNDMGLNNTIMEPNTKYIHIPVFIPIPVPVYIPVPTFIKEKPKPVELEHSIATNEEDTNLIVEATDVIVPVEQISTKLPTDQDISTPDTPAAVPSQEKHVIISNDDDHVTPATAPDSKKRPIIDTEAMPLSKQRKIDPSPVEKKESDGCKLKYTFGINAWRHWSKNVDLLTLSVVDFNKHMVEFVQKIRKPTNESYVPDSIFYLCLGIQLYLLEHDSDINLFVDFQFSGFQNELNKILATFKPKLGENHVLVCRIEEDHLWESKQLGSHSPGVLLFSVCYLLTKQLKFNTPEHHSMLSIDQLQLHESEIVFLSNTDNQTYVLCQETNLKRCFYKIVRTYIEKCAELGDKKSRCLYMKPLSKPVNNSSELWFDVCNADKTLLDMMLNRIRIVKEVQESLLSSN